ncbi:MAG: leucine-rich repeat domain-containing protein, partial [Bacteroidales bacterium]|nr:leucine-rich repeat domain-containing protein [Bacteroidales bacterium]
YQFDGEDGTASAEFSKVAETGKSGSNVSHTHAVYPYYADAKYTNTEGVETITVKYPEIQHYAPDSFGKGANVMYAVGTTENEAEQNLYFRNACGYLVIKLYGNNTTVRKISLSSLSGEAKIAGVATICASNDAEPEITIEENGVSTVTLDCEEGGVELASTSADATEFWFALPPVTFEGGIKIVVTDIDGAKYVKKTTKSVSVERNSIQPMAALRFEDLVPAPNQIWYTRSDDSTSPITFGSNDPFDAVIDSHEYDEDKGMFVIEFKESVKTIKSKAFMDAPLSTIALPDGLETIGTEAFAGSSEETNRTTLTSITIPGTVNLIDANAFRYCYTLKTVNFEPSPTQIPLSIECATDDFFHNTWSPFYFTEPEYLYLNRTFNYINEGEEFTPDTMDEALFSNALEITFGEQLTSIGDYMFADTRITELTIPSHISYVGKRAFYSCINLSRLTIKSGVTTIDQNAFQACEGLKEIIIEDSDEPISISCMNTAGYYGPFSHSPLESIYVGRNITYTNAGAPFAPDESDEGVFSMSDDVFESSTVTVQVTIGPKVSAINNYMFSNTHLGSITIPSTVKSVGYNAFEQCTYLRNVTIEASEESLSLGYSLYYLGATYEYGPFYDSPLATISLERELVYKDKDGNAFTPDEWDEGIFANKYCGSNDLTTEVTIGSSVRTIHPWMFSRVRLKEITIPSNVQSVGKYAFEDCPVLTTASIDAYAVGEGVFYNCSNLKAVIIGSNIFSIGHNSFAYCTNLASVTIQKGNIKYPLRLGNQRINSANWGTFYDSPLEYISIDRDINYLDYTGLEFYPEDWDEGVFANKHYSN